jgi:hypothetical protein
VPSRWINAARLRVSFAKSQHGVHATQPVPFAKRLRGKVGDRRSHPRDSAGLGYHQTIDHRRMNMICISERNI